MIAFAYPKPLILGNKKLGPIWHFSRTAITSCPGRSEPCEADCYACKGRYHMANVVDRLALNDAMCQESNFVSRTTLQIQQDMVQMLRIHPAGDFDSITYIRKWREIATRKPRTEMLAYTRSWRDLAAERAGEVLLPELVLLSKLPNVQLFFSCDVQTGAPPRVAGVRRAYMSQHDNDKPKFKVDLVFRVNRTTKITQVNDTLVCPAERQKARAGQKQVTCAQCRICFNRGDWLDNYNAKLRNPLPVLS